MCIRDRCNADESLWSWNSDDAPLSCTYNGFQQDNSGNWKGGGNGEFCAHKWDPGNPDKAPWGPQGCGFGYRVVCELPQPADACTPVAPIAFASPSPPLPSPPAPPAPPPFYGISMIEVDGVPQGSLSHADAQAECESRGGRLAILNTAEKQAAAVAAVPTGWAAWIGGEDADGDCTHHWSDGTEVPAPGTSTCLLYTSDAADE